jgi:thiol-disulfide isomerase/thioredoxin
MRYWKIFIGCLLVLTFVGCGDKPAETLAKDTYKDGDKVELTSVVGSKLTLLRKNGGFVLASDESKILILDIFGTFCVPCQEEAPDLMSFQIKNDKDVLLIGFNYLETVSNEYVVENFSSKFNAYYFIVNAPENEKMVNTITDDIKYTQSVQVPFKVVLENGHYQNITDIYDGVKDNKFYIGKVDIDIIQKDIDRIKAN